MNIDDGTSGILLDASYGLASPFGETFSCQKSSLKFSCLSQKDKKIAMKTSGKEVAGANRGKKLFL